MLVIHRTAIDWFQKFDCSTMAFDPPIPAPKSVDLSKSIKGRFFYLNEDVERIVNESLAAPIASSGHLLDFYQEFRSKPANNGN